MDVSKQIKASLQLLNNPNNITDDGYRKLLDNSFAALLNKPEIHNISTLNSSKADVIKEIYAALLTLIAEITRHNLPTDSIGNILQDDLNFSSNRKETFCKIYDLHKERLYTVLSSIGSHPPHIVDVNWKMDYILKTSSMDQADGPIFRIRLSTEVNDALSKEKKLEYVHFSCNTQQLQDLVYKLKDAVRHCEKLSLEN